MSPEPKVSDPKLPSAAERAQEIWQKWCDTEDASITEMLTDGLAEFQRDTLLASAREFRKSVCGANEYGVAEWLERLAAEAGK